MNEMGIVYWCSGRKLLGRLAVSLCSLEKNWPAHPPIRVLFAHWPDGAAAVLRAGPAIFDERNWAPGATAALLAKSRMNELTPFERTVFVDCDTLILRPFPEVFGALDRVPFAATQYHTWPVEGSMIGKRVRQWARLGVIDESQFDEAMRYPKGINIGVFGFRRDARIFREWGPLARRGAERKAYIPDEVACQIVLPRYGHETLSTEYNSPCNRRAPTADTRVVHYAGRKHLSLEKTARTGTASMWIAAAREYARALPWVRNVFECWPYRGERRAVLE